MRKQFITKQWTFWGYLSVMAWLWVATLVIDVGTQHADYLFLVVFMGTLIFSGVQALLNKRRITQRKKDLEAFASANEHLGLGTRDQIDKCLASLGAIDELHGARDKKVHNLILGDDWQYCDFSYNLYGKTKHGEYLKATVYYGVLSSELPRELPNVFFDSKKARRRQFRFHFARSQRHSLEGDFDKFFVTYFPEEYTIDSMSFISPDVMWAMREAADYDIEIVGNRLFLYGPLYAPGQQIADMAAKAAKIKQELLDNILTYRDDRLPYAEGRKRVAKLGASLKLSKFWTIMSIIGAVLYILLRIALDIFDEMD